VLGQPVEERPDHPAVYERGQLVVGRTDTLVHDFPRVRRKSWLAIRFVGVFLPRFAARSCCC
jgi:hypothetical protein